MPGVSWENRRMFEPIGLEGEIVRTNRHTTLHSQSAIRDKLIRLRLAVRCPVSLYM